MKWELLSAFKVNNFCQAYIFRIKVVNVQTVYSVQKLTLKRVCSSSMVTTSSLSLLILLKKSCALFFSLSKYNNFSGSWLNKEGAWISISSLSDLTCKGRDLSNVTVNSRSLCMLETIFGKSWSTIIFWDKTHCMMFEFNTCTLIVIIFYISC